MNLLDLIIKAETEGLDSLDEAMALADGVYTSGLYRSQGSWGRFLQDMEDLGWAPPA